MKKLLLFTSCILLVASPAYAQSIPERAGVNSTLGIGTKTEDFVRQVAIIFEIESSKAHGARVV